MNYNKHPDRLSSTGSSYQQPIISSYQVSGSILNDIIQHPFIDTLPMDITTFNDSCCNNNIIKYKVILYRIRHHSDHHYVEFYLPSNNINESLFNIEYYNTSENGVNPLTSDDVITYLKEHLQYIHGTKRFKGHIIHNSIVYSVVHLREKKGTDHSNNPIPNPSVHNNNNWLTLWDIIAYKHVFREKIDHEIVDLFVEHHTIAHLFLNKRRCLLPMTLYCTILNKYKNFVEKNKSLQYCQIENSPIISLNCDYLSESNNVRNVCFIEDHEIHTTANTIQNQPYILVNNENGLGYLLKNDDNIISYIK